MNKQKLDIDGLVEVPISQLKRFLKFISENNLWDELESHLGERGCSKLIMSFEPVKAVGAIVESRSAEKARGRLSAIGTEGALAIAAQPEDLPTIRCGCNGPMGPHPGPVTPGGGGDAGTDAGSHPQ